MALIIPYTFKAGTKAKAAEVNANFQQTKQFVDSLETLIGEHDVEIMSMKDNKADINGSSNNRFRVADPVSSKDAVNKGFLTDSIENTIEVIRGLQCSKNSYSVITVAPGMCYDSTYKEAIRNYNYIKYTTPTKAKNTRYNIFICGNDTPGDVKITISTNNLTPNIPSGYPYYRRIGGLLTDTNGNISYVYSEANSYLDYILGIFPDYNKKTDVPNNYTVPRAGWLRCQAIIDVGRRGYAPGQVFVNGLEVCGTRVIWAEDWSGWWTYNVVPVSQGDIVTFSNTRDAKAVFMPCKGGF